MINESIEDKMANILIKEGIGLSTATVLAKRLADVLSEEKPTTEIKLPREIRNLHEFFPTSMLIGGSYVRYLEANTKGQFFNPARTNYNDIDIFIFHNITRYAMEEIINLCFSGSKVSVIFAAEHTAHPQYKMEGVRKVLKFEVVDHTHEKPTQKYDVIIIDPSEVYVSNEDWFMKQQASELSQICAVPNFSDKGYSILASQDLLTCNKQVHLRADKCTDEFRIKLRKQAQELGYKLI